VPNDPPPKTTIRVVGGVEDESAVVRVDLVGEPPPPPPTPFQPPEGHDGMVKVLGEEEEEEGDIKEVDPMAWDDIVDPWPLLPTSPGSSTSAVALARALNLDDQSISNFQDSRIWIRSDGG